MSRQAPDPQIPFIQVDRSSGQRAALVASACGLSPQFARGAMLAFWESFGDRRYLAKIIMAGGEAIVLTGKELAVRLRMAFGQGLDPAVLIEAGFLEPIYGGGSGGDATHFRVRGASRLLKTERGRLIRAGLLKTRVHGKGVAPPMAPPHDPPWHPLEGATEVIGHRSEVKRKEEEADMSAAPTAPGPSQLQEAWNSGRPTQLPAWREMTKGRRATADNRLASRPLAEWVQVIARIRQSAFCLGENDRGWVASPDWLLRPDTATRVLEGKYDNRGKPHGVRETTDEEWQRKMAHYKTDANGDLIL